MDERRKSKYNLKYNLQEAERKQNLWNKKAI